MLLWDFWTFPDRKKIFSFACVLVLVLFISKVTRVTTEQIELPKKNGKNA